MLIKDEIINILHQNKINFELYEHKAVFTADEAKVECSHIPGVGCKNLFLTDGEKFFLYVLPDEKKANLKEVAIFVGAKEKKLRFASAPDLMKYLGVEPGSVSPLCLLVTKSKEVKIIIDKDLNGLVTCHPGINTATVAIQLDDITSLLEKAGLTCVRF